MVYPGEVMRLILLASLIACGGRSSDEPTDPPADRPDPWEDDDVVQVGQDLDGLELQTVQWFGYDADGTRLAVIERREGVRPIGAALFALEDPFALRVDSEDVFEETGEDGIIDVRTDEDGAIGFTTAQEGCWGLWDPDGLQMRCVDTLPFEVGVTYLGPLVRGTRPIVATAPDRRSYRIGAWDGTGWSGWTEPPAERAVGIWAFEEAERLWIAFDGVLERVVPERREEVLFADAVLGAGQLDAGSGQIRGLALTAEDDLVFLASGLQNGAVVPGSGLFRLDGAEATPLIDLTEPVAEGARVRFQGRGGQPALTWAPGSGTDQARMIAELDDDTTGVFAHDGSWRTLLRSGDPATDRFGEPIEGQRVRAVGSAIAGPVDSMVVTAVLEGDGVTGDNRYAAYLVEADGSVTLVARTGERVPGTTELTERIVLHGGAIVFPDPRDEDPARRRGVPDAGRDNDASLLMWGARHWNRSIDTPRAGCISVLVGLTGELDTALVEREVGEGC